MIRQVGGCEVAGGWLRGGRWVAVRGQVGGCERGATGGKGGAGRRG